MNKEYDYNSEKLENNNKVDKSGQLYFDALEISQINKKSKKSDVDAINNRKNFNDNKPFGVVEPQKKVSSKLRNNPFTKKNHLLKKQELNKQNDDVSKKDKDNLSSKKEETKKNQIQDIASNKKDGIKDKVNEKAKENVQKKAVAQKLSNSKVKGKVSITLKLKILKIGLIVGGILFGIILLAAFIGYILEELIPGIFDSNNWDDVESKLNDDEYMTTHFNSFTNKFSGSSGACKYVVGESSYSNFKVRLYKNDSFELVYSDDRLIDFDKYILGVAYQEAGGGTDSISEQVFKTQAIAARSYALTRGREMGVNVLQITEENGYSVINIRQTVSDQAYCDPDEGYLPSGQLSNCSSGHLRLPDDSPLRKWAKEVEGVVLVDSNGEVVNTPYNIDDQTVWRALAQSGMTSDEIILKHYNAAEKGYTLNATCVKTSSVEGAEGWKQCDPRWGNMYVGSKTICSIGCALTSISIQLARSGVQLNVSGEFNPGTFMQTHKSNGGFSDNIITWNVSRIAPNFKLIASHEALFGTKENKINTLKKYAANGEYIVLGVRHGVGQDIGHYVAYNDSSSDEIFIFDPAGNTTGKLFHDYPAMANAITSFQVVRYKVEG